MTHKPFAQNKKLRSRGVLSLWSHGAILGLSLFLICSRVGAAEVGATDKGNVEVGHDAVGHNEDEGFVSISTESLPSVSGERLMKTAYGVIFSVFLLYALSLFVRERRIGRRLEKLDR